MFVHVLTKVPLFIYVILIVARNAQNAKMRGTAAKESIMGLAAKKAVAVGYHVPVALQAAKAPATRRL